jgi:signal transduction histidine kinase
MKINLADKILLIFFFFSTVLAFLINFFLKGSIEQMFILCVIFYVSSFLVTYLISKRFSKSLLSLSFGIQEAAAGNFKKVFKAGSRDEVGQLANSLNELMQRLRTGVAIEISKEKEIAHAKTDFVAIASHQLRTPLSTIKWYADFLVSGDAGDLSEVQKKYLTQIYVSNERLIELVNGLLDVSRIDVGTFSIEPEPTDVIEKMETALCKFKKDIEVKNLTIEKSFDVFGPINLDPRLTKIVFENIVSNSVKYTPEGGKIRVEIKKTDKDIFIKVSDTGMGIPREQQPKIFTKLFRADNAKKAETVGNGLGLYIAKAVIEKSGGKIWFESPSLDLFLEKENHDKKAKLSKESKGSTFFITIPLKGMKKKYGTKKLNSAYNK